MSVTKKAAAVIPEKRARPNFAGVPGELIAADGLDLVFGSRLKVSPYDALLEKLAAAPGMFLRFPDPRAKASVYLRAKKKGFRLSYAEKEGLLFVRFDGRVDDDVRAKRRLEIMEVLKLGPSSPIPLANKLRERGDAGVQAGDVETICLQLIKTGELVRQEGNTFALKRR